MTLHGVGTQANENSVRHKLNLSTEEYSPLQIKELSLIFCFDVILEQKNGSKSKSELSPITLQSLHFNNSTRPCYFPIQLSLNMAKIYNILVT